MAEGLAAPAIRRPVVWRVLYATTSFRALVFVSVLVAIVCVAVVAGVIAPDKVRAAFALTVEKLIENLHWLVPAAVGVVIVRNDLRLRLELHRKEVELFEKEIELSQQRFSADQADRDERRKLFLEESNAIHDISEPLSKKISDNLTKDTRWASEAMERSRLGTHGQTVFGERVGHFLDEKKFLAEHFAPMLLARCARLSGRYERIYLLIDSGTTLYPFFSHLGELVLSYRESGEAWTDKIEIVTNNLPGVEALIDSSRTNPRNRFSPLGVRCQLLPGEPLPVYAAVTGKETEEAVRALRQRAENSYFIALMTGNWILMRPKGVRCPIPLARGKGHLGFKQAVIDCANETFIIAPLGKIWFRADLPHINSELGLSAYPDHRDIEKQPYDNVQIETDEKAQRVKLVSTTRGPDRVLSGLYHHLEIALQIDKDDENPDFAAADEPTHVLLSGFDEKPGDWPSELKREFPHRSERRHVREHDFYVPAQPPASRQHP